MTPPTADHAWPPASPTQLASTLLTSLQHVTSSARLFLTGCFQCQFLKAGCWRRQDEQDGAWFDCDKLQVEHPYCYVNPLAVSEANSTAAPFQPPLPQAAALALKSYSASAFKTSPQRSPGSGLTPRGLSTQSADTLPKHLKKININGGLVSETEWTQEDNESSEENSPLRDRVALKDGVARYIREQGATTPLVESFAAKLEADLKRIEHDRQRAEGEVLEAASAADIDDLLHEQNSPKGCLDAVFLTGTSSIFPYEDIEESTALQTDVWKSTELEDVFECYNIAAFYSYGATLPTAEKFASKVRGEKFEEVFPVSHHHHNNNNNIKVYKEEGSSDSPLPLLVLDRDEVVIESSCATFENKEDLPALEHELKQFIHACVLGENITEVDKKYSFMKCNKNRNFKDVINFSGKSFNKLLIFNLVKSVMSECAAQYPHSLSLCATYPVHLVQRKVTKVMLKEDRIEDNLCGLQMFHSPALQMQQEKKFQRKLVESVAASEVKGEDRQWQNFSNEEQDMKETIFNEMLHDLINDTTDVFKELVAKKQTLSQKSEGEKKLQTGY
ncbi:uncharacterized protein LOC123500103 [Portunus trituberculatus]|uniref:uncharacterized protein LOC123500103 n=1 Tax=Portunus trituberculatus TaxID=210409 RepID=UPI001E1CCCF7|nr:uncharacterized protein LOC123500103 [Portunus trituberculatus]